MFQYQINPNTSGVYRDMEFSHRFHIYTNSISKNSSLSWTPMAWKYTPCNQIVWLSWNLRFLIGVELGIKVP